MKSVMKHQFSQIPSAEIQRSVFNRSRGYKTTFDAGYLVPFYFTEVLPGDSFNVDATLFARLSTLLHPIMDNMTMSVFYFAVPLRLVWTNFQRFMGERDPDPDSSTDFTVPQLVAPKVTGFVANTLDDYFGLPLGVASLEVAAFHHRAYNLIWNEWFRDENIQDSVVVDKGDANSDSADYVLLRRGKRHDYFTSCLPWPQKNTTTVTIPLGGTAPVLGIGKQTQDFTDVNKVVYEAGGSATTTYAHSQLIDPSAGATKFQVEKDANGYPWIRADLANATAATINSLRQAFQLQRLYERDARGGTRYTEIVRAHFNVTSPDARLQRPEYLGGTSAPVHIMPVAQTSESGTTKQANLAAFGTVTCRASYTKSFTEHCVVIGLVCIDADLTYQQGLQRMWSRSTRWDFYWPVFAHLGEQAVLTKEIFCDGSANDEIVFGYQERWAEYRYAPSLITGELRSSFAQTLDSWHLSEEFETYPTLSPAFIESNPPIDRISAVSTAPHFIFDSYIKEIAARPMPVYSVPGLIDHF